jgi:hypothetical protein
MNDLTSTQEKVLAYLRETTKPGCESCKKAEGYYCNSQIGCDWDKEIFRGERNSWAGYIRDDDKFIRIAKKLGDKIDAAEVTKRLEVLNT